MSTTETYDDPKAFLAALKGTKRTPAKAARPGLPRAPSGEGDRISQLMRIAVFGFSPRFDPQTGYSFWHPTTNARTTAQSTYAAACVVAEKELR